MKKKYTSPCCCTVTIETGSIIATSDAINARVKTQCTDDWGNSNERKSEIWSE